MFKDLNISHKYPEVKLIALNNTFAEKGAALTRGRTAAEGWRRGKCEVRLNWETAALRWRPECWEMLKVLQSNMHLRIWGVIGVQIQIQISLVSLRFVYMLMEFSFSGGVVIWSAVLTFALLLVLLNFNSLLSALLIPHFLLPQALSLLQVI